MTKLTILFQSLVLAFQLKMLSIKLFTGIHKPKDTEATSSHTYLASWLSQLNQPH